MEQMMEEINLHDEEQAMLPLVTKDNYASKATEHVIMCEKKKKLPKAIAFTIIGILFVLVLLVGTAHMATTNSSEKIMSQEEEEEEGHSKNTFVKSFNRRILEAESNNFQFLSTDGAAVGTTSYPSEWLKSVTIDWMSALPDDTPLNAISIPGTHNSGAKEGGASEIGAIIGHGNWVRTQAWTISQQLSAGIRYFDIRCRRAGTSFAIHHGEVFLELFFGSVLNEMRSFLNDHPGETILMRVKEEHTPQGGSQSFGDIWDLYTGTYGYGDLFATYLGDNVMPTLANVRGKIVVLRNQNEIDEMYGMSYSNYNAFVETQDKWKIQSLVYDDGITIDEKKQYVTHYIDKAKTSSKIILNHLSAIGPPDVDTLEVAEYTNSRAYEYIGSDNIQQNVGVLIMDWPGDGLIYRIIKRNFQDPSSTTCLSKSIRFTGRTTWAEFQLPSNAFEGDIIHFEAGARQKYKWPACRRVTWSDVQFVCGTNGEWTKISGSFGGRDNWCSSYNTNQPYLVTGSL